jgi:aspartate-semialdehyde dehydrogenase
MKKRISIIGATGAVGKEVIKVLFDRKFELESLSLYASDRSSGKTQSTEFGDIVLRKFDVAEVQDSDIVFLCVSGEFAKEYAKVLTEKGAVVIDNSSAFRLDEKVPLVVPEVNAEAIGNAKLIANPNCTTAILAVVLYPIFAKYGLKKVIISTYQATSGAGQPAMDELRAETQTVLNGGIAAAKEFVHPIAFNLIPQIDSFLENGYTKEEMKVVNETRKIFGDESLSISVTAVRIPTLRAHAESVTVETEKEIYVDDVRQLLQSAEGVELVDDTALSVYPMPLTATEKYDVEVGRIRKNLIFGAFGLDFFICGDQLLKGAALNAVQIAEKL